MSTAFDTAASTGTLGRSDIGGGSWASFNPQEPCSTAAHLYCLQQ